MSQFVRLLQQRQKKQQKYFRHYLNYGRKIKQETERMLGKSRVIIFGSVLKKDEIPQDIDLLIISPSFKKALVKSKIRQEIQKRAAAPSPPFEFHLITPQQYRHWYRYFLEEKIEIK